MSPTNPPVMADEAPQRGEVWIVRFGPSIGGETQKIWPSVVLSKDTANALLNRVQVVPISSQVFRLYPAEAYMTLNGERRTRSRRSANSACNGGWAIVEGGYGGGRERWKFSLVFSWHGKVPADRNRKAGQLNRRVVSCARQ